MKIQNCTNTRQFDYKILRIVVNRNPPHKHISKVVRRRTNDLRPTSIFTRQSKFSANKLITSKLAYRQRFNRSSSKDRANGLDGISGTMKQRGKQRNPFHPPPHPLPTIQPKLFSLINLARQLVCSRSKSL